MKWKMSHANVLVASELMHTQKCYLEKQTALHVLVLSESYTIDTSLSLKDNGHSITDKKGGVYQSCGVGRGGIDGAWMDLDLLQLT